MDFVTSFYHLFTRNYRNILPNLLKEIFVRILLLCGLTLMHFKFQPQARCIVEEEMISEYKKPRRDSLIPPWIFIAVIILFPLFILCLPLLVTKSYLETTQALLGWTLSMLLNAFLTEFLKLLVLRPRPDFFYRCFPNEQETVDFSRNILDIVDGRKSFPSGHSSFAFCSLGFLSLWLRGMCGRNIVVDVTCFLLLLLSTIIGVSRCYDNHHHWQDVLAGAVLGFSTSYVCCKFYCKQLNRRYQRDT